MNLKPAISTMCTLALLCGAGAVHAQTTQYEPPTDTSAQASPLTAPPKAPVNDSSAQASPIPGTHTSAGASLAPGTAIRIVLADSLNSGSLKNGQSVQGRLASDLQASGKAAALRQGTPVRLTVVGTVPAGKMNAAGELSLQVERVGSVSVVTDILTFHGTPGHQDLPDSAPAKGTEATLAGGAELTFHVQAEPVAAQAAPGSVSDASRNAAQGSNSGKP